MVVAGFFLATLVAPAVLRRTRAWWVTGLALAGFGVYLFLTLDHGEPGFGAWYALGNMLQVAYGVVMLVYAALVTVVLLAIRDPRSPEPPIPPAKVL